MHHDNVTEVKTPSVTSRIYLQTAQFLTVDTMQESICGYRMLSLGFIWGCANVCISADTQMNKLLLDLRGRLYSVAEEQSNA